MFRVLSHFVHFIGTVLLLVGTACQVYSIASSEWIVHKLSSDNGLSYFEGDFFHFSIYHFFIAVGHLFRIQVYGIDVQFNSKLPLFNGRVGNGKDYQLQIQAHFQHLLGKIFF